MARPGGADDTGGGEFGPRHHRGALGHFHPDVVHLLDFGIGYLAQEIPDGCRARYHVRLIASIGDHVVRPLLQPQMLASKIPADVHQLHRIERAAAAPRRARRMRRFSHKVVLDADQPGARARPVAHVQPTAYVGEYRDIHILEEAVSDEVCLGGYQLLGDPRPDLDRAGKVLAFH